MICNPAGNVNWMPGVKAQPPRSTGSLPGAALDEIVGKVKALDMDDVRRQIAEAEQAEAAK